MEIASYFQSATSFFTPATIWVRRQSWTGIKLAMSLVAGGKDLYVGSAYIDNQHIHRVLHVFSSPSQASALLEAITSTRSFQELTKRFGPVILELCGQLIDVDARCGELVQHHFAIAAIGRYNFAKIPVIGEGLQSPLGHGVHRERHS